MRHWTILAGLLLVPAISFAQGSGPDEVSRQVLPGNVGPYMNASPHERYHYGNIQPLYLNFGASSFYDLEYLDRLDRQEKFGHRWPSARLGSEFQVNRINNEYLERTERLERTRGRIFVGGGLWFGRSRWR
ncbi:MAG TPA: hypothetical protein PKA06_01570 [Gemmatales bacterium]|nr:hypothetical protein [Gemmatales bacterium]